MTTLLKLQVLWYIRVTILCLLLPVVVAYFIKCSLRSFKFWVGCLSVGFFPQIMESCCMP